MPKYERSLFDTNLVLHRSFLIPKALQMIDAVNRIHERGYVHMDIKEANVFVDLNGDWCLGDLGSCVPIGRPIRECTLSCLFSSSGNPVYSAALWKFDWEMLAVTLACQVDSSFRSATRTNLEHEVSAKLGACCGHLCTQILAAASKNEQYASYDVHLC